jgi:hypothetical protein
VLEVEGLAAEAKRRVAAAGITFVRLDVKVVDKPRWRTGMACPLPEQQDKQGQDATDAAR